jgi:hypothetical protein
MADQLFEGNVATRMTQGEAIASFFCIPALGNPGKDFGARLEDESRFAPP